MSNTTIESDLEAGGNGAPRPSGVPRTKALERALEILRAVGEGRGAESVSALARATGLPRPTVARTLATLADGGFVARAGDGGAWVLGQELVRLARTADPNRALLADALPILERLASMTGESTMLGVPGPGVALEIVSQVDAPRLVGVASWVGSSFPLHASSAGKLVLGELADEELDRWLRDTRLERCTERTIVDPDELRRHVRRAAARGYGELVDELEPGLAALSAAVRDPGGALVGMVGLSGPTSRLDRRRRAELRPMVLAAAAELARALARRT